MTKVWMLTQEDYTPVWDSLITRARYAFDESHHNAYFLNPEMLTQDDLWHIEGTKWQFVEAERVVFDVLWDMYEYNFFVTGYRYQGLYEEFGHKDISTVYWLNAAVNIEYMNPQSEFFIVKKGDAP